MEEYSYFTGKGGKPKEYFTGHWQPKKEVSGLHMYTYIDDEMIRIKEVVKVHTLPTGEKVEILKIQLYVKELGEFSKKPKKSTMWPAEWSLDKIKQVIKEASENVYKIERRKFRGLTKEGYKVEFWIDKETEKINNAYLTFD